MTQGDGTVACRGALGGGALVPYRQNGCPVAMSYADARASLVGCAQCGYLRFDPLPDDIFLARYYGEQYWDETAIRQLARDEYAFPGYRHQTAEILRAWSQYGGGSRSPRIHDVGCGVGTLVRHLRQQGIDATGSDLSTQAIAAGHALGNAALFRASLTEFLAARPAEQIDIFLMSHALEHVRDPIETLRELRAHLPRDGMLWLRVPNGLYQVARGRSWYDFVWLQFPNHIHYFTPRSLQCCFEAAGFALAEIRATTREDNPDLLFEDLADGAAALVGRDHLVAGLARNLLTQELQAVAVIASSARVPAETASLVDAVEPWGWTGPRAAPAHPVQSSAEFSTRQGGQGWRYQWSACEPESFVDMTRLHGGMVWLGPDDSQIGWNWVLPKPGARLRLSRVIAGGAAVRVRCETRTYDGNPGASYVVRIGAGGRVWAEEAVPYRVNRMIERAVDPGAGDAVTVDIWTDGAAPCRILLGISIE
ncbi:MAG: class I SAM-dependent methyltransferase [Pseudomonadota bacterium]